MTLTTTTGARRWDIFCQVIDNFGDIGVCWRLAADLGARGERVRLWVDDASALAWMAPSGAPHVQVMPWNGPIPEDGPGDVVIEAFGCEIPQAFVAAIAHACNDTKRRIAWINLEYLSAEDYVERCHALPSPIMSGPAAGLTRWFFYPGFTERTGGLLREPGLLERQQTFDRNGWRAHHGLSEQDIAICLFSYEPPVLAQMLAATREQTRIHWMITPGRSTAAVRQALAEQPWPAEEAAARLHFLPSRPQSEFDELLWACDLNLVRGEDSLVRALWAGQAFVWHIYEQHDNAHHDKLKAFLDWLQASPSLRAMHTQWNGLETADEAGKKVPDLHKDLLAEWRSQAASARERLLLQNDLLTQLVGFVSEKS